MFSLLTLLITALFALLLMARLNPAFMPSLNDKALALDTALTKTATFTGTVFDFGALFSPGGVGQALGAVVSITAIDFTTGDESYVGQLMESSDNTTFTACGPSVTISAAAGAQGLTVPGFVSQRYVALKLTLGGTTPSITYSSFLNPFIAT